jgi:hypothetical protein
MLPSGVSCERSAECLGDLVCSFNQCVVSTPNALPLQARITPPPTSGLLPQQLPALDLTRGPDLLVKLLAPITLRGLVRHEGETDNVAGMLEVRAAGDIDGLDFSFSTATLDRGDRDGFGYSLALLPGRSYTGTFRPSDPELPRHIFSFGLDELTSGRLDITLPARSAYRRVTGRVMRSDYVPVPRARVILLTSAREVAGVATSDEMRGFFEVLLPPTVAELYVKVEAPVDGPVFPEFTLGPIAPPSDSGLDLVVPDLPPGTEPLDIALRVQEPRSLEGIDTVELVPARGRTVTIVGAFPEGTLRRSGTTDDTGQVTFRGLPGAYEVLVVSPPQSPSATWRGLVNLGPPDTRTAETLITLSPRPLIVGRVLDAFGAPVEHGTLTLDKHVAWGEGWALAITPPPFETQLGEDGVFSARVDPGTYDAVIAPALETGAPSTSETGIEVGPDGLELDLSLPLPGLLHLTVSGPDGTWLPDVRVELWTPAEGKARLFALGTTGERGFVDMLIPHAAPAASSGGP